MLIMSARRQYYRTRLPALLAIPLISGTLQFPFALMFIPLKDLNPRRTYPFVNNSLILINVLVFLYQYTLPPHAFKSFVLTYATIPARFPAWLSGHGPLDAAFLPLLTSMFLHSG